MLIIDVTEQVALYGTSLHDKKRLAGYGAGQHRTERPCKTGNSLQDTELTVSHGTPPRTIENDLQDTGRVAPNRTPLHDKKRIAEHGAGHTARNVPAR